ncbi:DNA-directed RNA polymerase II, putative [Ricinus communis]|uniref:DNA-directed RNA polymerase II, putative n=1 Tax=Ricinus communis TaxID=3988 RepID=B9RGC5_RICCO|nr:DNA-directed RNA polymerase II, putative [Ricinus communis]
MATGADYLCLNGGGGGGGGGGDDRRGRVECLTKFVEQASLESQRYYLSRKTVMEMLRDRGYDVADSELTGSFTEFLSEFGDNPDILKLRISASLHSHPDKKMVVVFMGTEEIKLANIRGLLCQIKNKESLNGLILILQSKMNHYARKELGQFPSKVEIFHISDLLVNITKHVLKPRHEVLTAEQKQQLLNKFSSEDKQLPRMLVTDAISRYYGFEKGQVVKITYSGGLVDSLVTYRCVT